MAQRLDMSLDDLIKNNKNSGRSHTTSRGGGRGHGRSRGRDSEHGPGPTRRFDNRLPIRMQPYFIPQDFQVQNMVVGGESSYEEGTKLYVSNLDYEVTNEDIKVLFSDVGELKRYSIHYDRSGRSKGTAEVVYMRRSDALAAMKRYDNVQLDGKPMRLELVGVNIVTPVPVPQMPRDSYPVNHSQSTRGRIFGRGQVRGGNHHASERGNGGGQNPRSAKLSADDLDADLERYRLQAMHMN